MASQGWVEYEDREANPWRTVQDTGFCQWEDWEPKGNSGRGFPGYTMQSSSQSLQSSQRTNRSYVLECLIYLWFLSCLSTFVSFSYILATLKNGRKNKWQGQKKLTSKKALWLTRSDAFHSPCVVRLWKLFFVEERRIRKNPQWEKNNSRRDLGEGEGQFKIQ